MAKLLYNLAVKGVDYSIDGNGGPECVQFIPLWQRLCETLVFVPLGIYCISLAWDYLEWPQETRNETRIETEEKVYSESNKGCMAMNGSTCNNSSPPSPSTSNTLPSPSSSTVDTNIGVEKVASDKLDVLPSPLHAATHFAPDTTMTPFQQQLDDLRIWILGIYGMVFALEMIYKAMTNTGIFLANPCHQTTMLQLILLLLGKNNPRVTQIFRFQMYVMPGAFFALAFPILNTRLLIGEVFIYFVQHVFILIIPFYLLCLGGHYRPETYHNLAWPMFSMSIIVLYHFVFLQTVGYFTLVNLNCILCPAISDPLGNRFWRIAAFTHQCILVPILSKSYSYYGQIISSYLFAAHEEKGPEKIEEEDKKK
uniref:Transmembrane protein 164 n=1 Tax=Panagrolaimus superbus TaxID=310955 RepID=A0A914XXR4_9BILA